MPTYSFKRAPGAVTADYKLIAGGDKYNLSRGTLADPNNISVASVVNYSVAANIIAASASWTSISSQVYETKKVDFISYLVNSVPSEFIPDDDIAYWMFEKKTFFAVTKPPKPGPIAPPPPFSETINYNEETLEFNVIRNNDVAYVKALNLFLEESSLVSEWPMELYNSVRTSVLETLSTEGADIPPPIDFELAG
jgi:hypothetical protein